MTEPAPTSFIAATETAVSVDRERDSSPFVKAPADLHIGPDDARSITEAVAPRPVYTAGKRIFDLLFAFAFLAFSLPILLVVCLLIRLTSSGPIFFSQRRVGRDGQVFQCYKFRTMLHGAETLLEQDVDLRRRFEESWKLEHDPRVTPVGRWLRKLSVDEIPQMFNVIIGDMSIVGPRPVQERELAVRFGPTAAALVTSVKPGLASLWIIAGRSKVSYEKRVALEIEYVRRRGFVFDFLIVIKTILPVLTRRGAV